LAFGFFVVAYLDAAINKMALQFGKQYIPGETATVKAFFTSLTGKVRKQWLQNFRNGLFLLEI
jgi:hypothetical protein